MRQIVAIMFCLSPLFIKAQLGDAQWALGDKESVVDFRNLDSVRIDSLPTLQYFILTNASICDASGNLLYYTNGVNICGTTDILTGGGLCRCLTNDSIDGLDFPQAALFLPKPGDTRYYYLFHFWNDTLQNTRPGTLYYSLIDSKGNNGLGAVVKKNVPLLSGEILRGGGMVACKHANGRDYWLVIGSSNNNGFYKFLVTPDSIMGPYTQNIGPDFPLGYDIAYSKFSQDGSKYATGIYSGPIVVLDFDRCSGEFANPTPIFHMASTDPIQNPLNGCASLEFSMNGEFLYVNNSKDLTQYDLWSSNIQDSSELYRQDSSDLFGIDMIQLAPNGKLYGSTWNGGLKALHVINYPDLKGDSSNFVFGGQPTYTLNSFNLPNLINYRLGPLIGSGCDTITSTTDIKTNQEPRVIPNPADKYAYVEMGMQGNYEFDLINEAGQLVDKKQTPQVDIFDTERLSSGVYLLTILDKTTLNKIATQKVVVQH